MKLLLIIGLASLLPLLCFSESGKLKGRPAPAQKLCQKDKESCVIRTFEKTKNGLVEKTELGMCREQDKRLGGLICLPLPKEK
jgi:hypothetical protein